MDLTELQRDRAGADEPPSRHPWEVCRAAFFRRIVRDLVPLDDRSRVLDVGAGDGWLAGELLPDLPAAASVTCWDINYDAADLQVELPERIERTSTRPDGRFDLVMLLDVLEHVADDETFLRDEIIPLLAPDAWVLVSVPAHPSLFSSHDEMLGHHRRYRPTELQTLLSRHLTIDRRGALFSSLVIPRWLQVRRERAGHRRDQHGVGAWNGATVSTAAVTAALRLDSIVGYHLARTPLTVPGLSTWALCRPQAAQPHS